MSTYHRIALIVALVATAQTSASISLLPPKGFPLGDKYHAFAHAGIDAWVAADLEGDGKLEFVVAATTAFASMIQVLRRDASGVLVQAEIIAAPNGAVTVLAAGDVDGDGRIDIAFQQWNMPTFQVLRQTAPGSWTPTPLSPSDPNDCCGDGLQLFDWDGDGDSDVVMRSAWWNEFMTELHDSFEVYAWDQDAATFVMLQSRLSPYVSAQLVTDLDGDGGRDLLGVHYINTFPDDLDGGLWIARDTGAAWATATSFGVSDRGTGSLSTGDFDADGDLDVVLSGGVFDSPQGIQLFMRQADGGYAAQPSLFTHENPMAVAAGDIDGDGASDIVVANSGFNMLTVVPGMPAAVPTQAFPIPTVCEVGTCSSLFARGQIGIADVNGDGELDVLLGDPQEGLEVFYNAQGSLPTVDLSFAATTSPTVSRIGQSTTFTLRVRNAGPSALTSGMLIIVMPEDFAYSRVRGCTSEYVGTGDLIRLRCALGALAAGARKDFTARGNYAGRGTTQANEARVVWYLDAHEVDTVPGNNRGYIDIAVEDIPETLPPAGASGGGGGVDPLALLLLGAGLTVRWRRRASATA